MAETPTVGHVDDFGLVEFLLGVSPFVFLVGVLTGLLAAVCVYPFAWRTGAGFVPADRPRGRQCLVPAAVGGVGLLVSLWVETLVFPPPDAPGAGTLLRCVLVAGGLAAALRRTAFRDVTPSRRRASRTTYAAFVAVWAAVATYLFTLP